MECLEESELAQQQQQYQVPFFSIGPLCKFATASSSRIIAEDSYCITWLDRQTPNSVIYVSLGSLASMAEKELAEMAWGLANSEQPFLWVIRPNSVCGSEWIELLPKDFKEAVEERGCIVKWAPQKELLANSAVGGFWSHCGWNSTVESICEGVPMICRPCFGDQKVNARYVSHVWKVGLELENELEREKVARAVRRLMSKPPGKLSTTAFQAMPSIILIFLLHMPLSANLQHLMIFNLNLHLFFSKARKISLEDMGCWGFLPVDAGANKSRIFRREERRRRSRGREWEVLEGVPNVKGERIKDVAPSVAKERSEQHF
ncbi:hypothetical protein GH714_011448 [Hevea brasiliensis]|uniref:Anthocyanidin 3-O-glucosyltransferase n=1 Tax=Hevea brasiliensis TaxID=3981 RepID=A0A6A6L0S1_HEVBR|nr:hypothetical protein GH714_011448 [Hevea brasiliensis]